MGRKFVFLLKLLVGSYLIFVGATLLRTFLNERPSNLQAMCVAASLFILAGAGYIIVLFVRLLKRKKAASRYYMEEPQTPVPQGNMRDESIFRIAPMSVLGEEKQDNLSERHLNQEQKTPKDPSDRTADRPSNHTLDRKTATIQLQTVGPDTVAWKK